MKHILPVSYCARLLALLALLLSGHSLALRAATLRVGPTESLARIADAAGKAQDGDIVEILPGEHRRDVAVWKQKSLTIRVFGHRQVLIAEGKSAEGKAIWVIRNGDYTIENIEFLQGTGAGTTLKMK